MASTNVHFGVFDGYGDFDHARHFANAYDCYASEIDISVPFERTQAHLEALPGHFDLATHDLRPVTEDTSISRPGSKGPITVPTSYYFAGAETPVALHFNANGSFLNATFYYDLRREGLREWCRDQLLALREKFGKPERPRFHVLTVTQHGFGTESVEIEPLALDLGKHYNADFAPVDADVRAALDDRDRSGLILLHGQPGTGKTSYIKHLIAAFPDTEFIFVPNDMVRRLLQPDFVSFMVSKRRSVLVIEDAEKVIQSREQTREASVVSTILQLTDGLFSDYLSVKVVCTFNTDVSRIDQALFRKGRLIGFYEFEALSAERTAALVAEVGGELPTGKARLTLAEVYNLERKDYVEGRGRKIGF